MLFEENFDILMQGKRSRWEINTNSRVPLIRGLEFWQLSLLCSKGLFSQLVFICLKGDYEAAALFFSPPR